MTTTFKRIKTSTDRVVNYNGMLVTRPHNAEALDKTRFDNNNVPWMSRHTDDSRYQIGSVSNPQFENGALYCDYTTDDPSAINVTKGVSLRWQPTPDARKRLVRMEGYDQPVYEVDKWEVMHSASVPMPRHPDVGFGAKDDNDSAVELLWATDWMDYEKDDEISVYLDSLQTKNDDDIVITANDDTPDDTPDDKNNDDQKNVTSDIIGGDKPDDDDGGGSTMPDNLMTLRDSYEDSLVAGKANELYVQAVKEGWTDQTLEVMLQNAKDDSLRNVPTVNYPHDSKRKGGLDKIKQFMLDNSDVTGKFTMPMDDLNDCIKSSSLPKLVLQKKLDILVSNGNMSYDDAVQLSSTAVSNAFVHTVQDLMGLFVETTMVNNFIPIRQGLRGEQQFPGVKSFTWQHRGETDAINYTDPTFDGMTLKPEKHMSYGLETTYPVLETWSEATVEDVLAQIIVGMSEELDYMFLDGSGSGGQVLGIMRLADQLPALNKIAATNLAAVTYEFLAQSVYKRALDVKIGERAIWLLSNSVYTKGVSTTRVTNGQESTWFDNGSTLLTRPFMRHSAITTDKLAIVDPRCIVIGVWGDMMRMAVDTTSSAVIKYNWSTDYNVGYRRYDGIIKVT